MRNTVLASIGLGAVLTLAWFVSAPLSGQAPGGTPKGSAVEEAAAKYEAPRTSWGDPDLQGQWNSQTSTPLERPRSGALAEKDSLSEEEAESVESANLARADGPPAPGDPGTYNSFWFDRAGNFHSADLHVVERYTRTGPDVLQYEATIEDPKVFTRPWTIRMPLYRRLEKNAQLLEYKCVEFVEELMYGHLRKKAGT